MKFHVPALIAIFIFASCQKKIDTAAESINGDVVASDNALYPEPCHAVTFSTNYPTVAGKTPPFRFTKTQYASGRIKTINMLSRANPNHAAFKQQAWEVIGTFTYYSNKANLTGTKQLWEYYKTATGAAGRKSIIKKNINLTFTFGGSSDPYWLGRTEGEVYQVYNNVEGRNALLMNTDGTGNFWPFYIDVLAGSDEPETFYEVESDYTTGETLTLSSINTLRGTPAAWKDRKTIAFKLNPNTDYSHPNRVFQPTQNWVSLEYTICEVMGWVGLLDGHGAGTERASVTAEFYPYNTSYKVVQSQVYKNYKYGGSNLLSYTYGDGVLQKATWICK